MRTLGIGTCLIVILTISALLNHESGVEIWRELRAGLSESAARVGQLRRENDEMRNEIEMLKAEPAALDRAIREELDVALPGEIVVRFTSPGRPEDRMPVTDDRDWMQGDSNLNERPGREMR